MAQKCLKFLLDRGSGARRVERFLKIASSRELSCFSIGLRASARPRARTITFRPCDRVSVLSEYVFRLTPYRLGAISGSLLKTWKCESPMLSLWQSCTAKVLRLFSMVYGRVSWLVSAPVFCFYELQRVRALWPIPVARQSWIYLSRDYF